MILVWMMRHCQIPRLRKGITAPGFLTTLAQLRALQRDRPRNVAEPDGWRIYLRS
jgi:hypothetical protein